MHFLLILIFALGPVAVMRGDEGKPPEPKKLVVEVKVVEVATTKLRNLGFDWAQLGPAGARHESLDKILQSTATDQLFGFLEALRQNNLARVLAEPTIATLDGRPASLAVGGTQLDVVPIVLGNGHVRLEYRIELAPQQMEQTRPTNGRDTSGKPTPLRLDAAAELELAKTSLVGRTKTNMQTPDGKTQEAETLIFVRVDLLKSGVLPIGTAAGTDVEDRGISK